ncbi:OmpA family protein [Niabella insulamsoli]|uniref:OmpA family protein n=1 Tax=Niabella insulamsoli TaxID=3144874 RepID=UPI0031FCFDA7
MKILAFLIAWLLVAETGHSQIIDPKRAARRAAENRANQKIDQGIDKGLDKVEEGIGSIFKKKGSKPTKSNEESSDSDAAADRPNQKQESGPSGFSATGKFDFIPGERVIGFEDFSQDGLGDFPAKWNTNGSGTLSKLNDNPNKFLMTNSETVFYPEFIKGLPDNFTVEFDLASTPEFSYYSGYFVIGFTSEPNIGKSWGSFKKYGNRRNNTKLTVELALHPTGAGGDQGMSVVNAVGGDQEIVSNDLEQKVFATKGGKNNVHVSIWRQKGRLRVYLNESKIWDIPRAFGDGSEKINAIYFRNDGPGNDAQQFFVGNVRVAVGAPDTRSKLITEGKFVTTGILFDVNSDKIKGESYGVLKDIANVLSENATVRVKIIGHTDSDGDEAANLSLSKKRAEAVKKALSSEFGIAESRMSTEGKGETQPAADNTTPEGKANNRRVEFIKQ